MKIIINFLNGTTYWQNKIKDNAAIAERILSDPRFLDMVSAHEQSLGFDFAGHPSYAVAEFLGRQGDVQVNVGFYCKWLTRAIAYEADRGVYFNTRKEAAGAGSPGNIAHEVMHALGNSHNGNSPSGNQNTVPYWIGNMVDAWVQNPPVDDLKLAAQDIGMKLIKDAKVLEAQS